MTTSPQSDPSAAFLLTQLLDDAEPYLPQVIKKANEEGIPFEELIVVAEYEPNGDVAVSGIPRDDYLSGYDAKLLTDPVTRRTYDAMASRTAGAVPLLLLVLRDGYSATRVVRMDAEARIVRGERMGTDAGERRCSACGKKLVVAVHRSAAGYYIGTWCCEGPDSRDSGYYASEDGAAR